MNAAMKSGLKVSPVQCATPRLDCVAVNAAMKSGLKVKKLTTSSSMSLVAVNAAMKSGLKVEDVTDIYYAHKE